MIQVLDKLTDEEQQQVVIVKMDIHTYEDIRKKDPTIELHELEMEARKSKSYNNLDDLFHDLEN